MTRVVRKNRLFLPVQLPILAIRLAGVAFKEGRDLARSTHKTISKRLNRARRRRVNKRGDARDVALRNPGPKIIQQYHNYCFLLKLPLELRRQIYDLYFRPTTFTIHEFDMRGYKLVTTKAKSLSILPMPGMVPKKYLLELPLACRQLYCETIEYIYQQNTFRFTNHNLAFQLPRLSIFPRKHLDILRSLELKFCVDVLIKEFKFRNSPPDLLHKGSPELKAFNATRATRRWRQWTALWACLASLPRLEWLHVEFKRFSHIGLPIGHWDNTRDWMYEWILEPLLRFVKPERLSVFIVEWPKNWRLTDEWKRSTCMPFEMKWVENKLHT